MDLLADWLRTNESVADISFLIDKITSEINSLEADVRRELKLKDEEKWPYIFKDYCKYLKDVNVKVSDIDAKLRIFEEDTLPQARELRDSVVKKKEQLADSFASKAKQEEDEIQEAIENDDLELLNSEPLPEDEVIKCRALDRLARDYLREARALIKKDLFPLVKVGYDKTSEPITTEFTIDQSLFNFPPCKVSESVHDFVRLLGKILEDSNLRTENERILLYQASRDICELYLISLQSYSSDMVSEYHQYSAVHHNNCLYFSHNLMLLPVLFGLRDNDECIVTYIDMIPALKEAAYGCITARMKKDKQIIKDFIRDPSVSGAIQSNHPKVGPEKSLRMFEKALKRSLSHIASVRNAWQDILPVSVCNKLVATLINTLVFLIVDSVLKLEDISTETANELETIFERFSQDVEDLMKDFPLHFSAVMPKWFQFQELRFVLQVN